MDVINFDIGKLRHRVDIYAVVRSANEYNESVISYPSITSTRWAEIVALSGEELINASKLFATVTHRVNMRYFGLTPEMQLGFGSRRFEIGWINNVNQQNVKEIALVKELISGH